MKGRAFGPSVWGWAAGHSDPGSDRRYKAPMASSRPLLRLQIEAVGGIAGDMLLGALIDIGADVEAIRAALALMRVPGLRLDLTRVQLGELQACYVRSLAPDAEGTHSHRHLSDIYALIDRAGLAATAWQRARDIFRLLAEAEAEVHGGDATEVALHEVGRVDSILDVVGIAIALDSLGNPRVSATALPVGQGTVQTAHGELAVPVPAVVAIARRHRVPLVNAPLLGETVTPTGIAVVAAVSSTFDAGPWRDADVVGFGAGTRRHADRPNVVCLRGAYS